MLLGDFFEIQQLTCEGQQVTAGITLQKNHAIFKGHFPGHPVVPGVCMLQMVKEVMEQHLQQPLQLVKGDNLKFLSFIDPTRHPQIILTVQYQAEAGAVTVKAVLQQEPAVFFKCTATFILL